MISLQYELLARAEHDRVVSEAPRCATPFEFVDRIIQNAQQAIQRSRKLLEQTKHQAHPGTGGAYLGINPAGAHAAGIVTSSVRSRSDFVPPMRARSP